MQNYKINKEEWIDSVIDSADTIKRHEVNPFIFTRISNRISTGKASNLISIPKIAAGFAAVLLLFALNFGLIRSDIKNINSSDQNKVNTQTQTIPQQVNPYLEYLTNN